MKKKISYLVSGALMMVLSLGVSKSTTTMVQELDIIFHGLYKPQEIQHMVDASRARNLFNCPTR